MHNVDLQTMIQTET